MSDRNKIFASIKKALSKQADKPMAQPNFVSEIYAQNPSEDLAVVFAQNLIAVQGNFCFCSDEQDFLLNLISLLKQKKTPEIFVWEKHLQEILNCTDVSYKNSEEDFLKAEIGITTCEALVARSGSIVVTSRQSSGRRLGVYPPVHIVVAFTSQLVIDVKTALQNLQQKYNIMPSMISFVTGPSRTADIEKTLVLGAHGPRELHVFLIDDFA
jgi:L-lactate dehydrogenase complex protein LldG